MATREQGLRQRVALVTGGSRGIGRACCEALAGAGAKIAVHYHADRGAADDVVRTVEADGGRAAAFSADLADRTAATALVDAVASDLGPVDVLVNNAGIWNEAPIEDLDDATWARMLDINLSGTMRTIRAVVPSMRRRGRGRIVNISSTAGQRGEARHSHYAATKGAVIALTKSLAVELCDGGIRVNCVAPGWVETDMTRPVLESDDRDRVLSTIPVGRMGRPDEVAAAVLFLASDGASYVHGEILNVNGGSVLCG